MRRQRWISKVKFRFTGKNRKSICLRWQLQKRIHTGLKRRSRFREQKKSIGQILAYGNHQQQQKTGYALKMSFKDSRRAACILHVSVRRREKILDSTTVPDEGRIPCEGSSDGMYSNTSFKVCT